MAAQPGVEPPDGCTVYDPEVNMQTNEQYRERMPLTDAGAQAGAALAEAASGALTDLRASGATLDNDAVTAALASAGLDPRGVQVQAQADSILFGAVFTPGDGTGVAGCIFGSVSSSAVSVDVGGLIMDGGCLPAVGH
ncbi:MAG: hypothetical protein NT132_04120 [Microbacterium sp.]|uniref:hypothetical protein n=1 Tax=Microbacterium sp. TaxID=51671 RepID=UPI00262CD61E|nr:hypothetical protein [Microbacterium sp.]MCX6501586.1 hypothetical protein [Microbacterium sp.]